MLSIRTYRASDAEPLIALWNEALPYDTVSPLHFLRKILLDCNFRAENLLIAEDKDEAVGFLYGTFRLIPADVGGAMDEELAYIVAAGAKESHRTEAMRALLAAFEEKARALGRKTIKATGFSPAYFQQGYDKERCADYCALFTEAGYTGYDSITMEIDLATYKKPDNIEAKRARLAAEGIIVRQAELGDVPALMDASEPFNSPGWVAQFRRRLLINNDLGSFRVAVRDGRVVGVCVFGDPDSSPERFGPFGVNSDLQGKGIGTVLLADILTEMKARTLHNAWMQWTSGTGASGEVYRRAGFTQKRTYVSFVKTL